MEFLPVYREQDRVGLLSLDEDRRFVFQYDAKWLHHPKKFPISVVLPLKEDIFDDNKSRPFFAGLLPEGEIRRLLTAQLGISPENDFKLLEEIGGDCAGALSLSLSAEENATAGSYRPLALSELEKRLDQTTPNGSLLTAQEGVRLSLAGVQSKLPVFWKEGEFFLPEGSAASSHILKPAMPRLENTTHNEGFCMTLALHIGLPVPEVKMVQIGNHWCCLIKRFDRLENGSGPLRRLHQEDFCQASGFLPDQKYEGEGGPGFDACFRILETESRRPAADKKSFIQWAVFNVLIGNADAHAKNAALLISEAGFKLAPFYDLLSTAPYPGLSKKLAMRIGEAESRGQLTIENWKRFSDGAGVKFQFVAQVIKEMCHRLLVEVEKVSERFISDCGGDYLVRALASEIEGQSKAMLKYCE